VSTQVRLVVRRFLAEDNGQDLVEYALLTTFIGVAAVAAWNAMEIAIGTAYTGLNDKVYDLWEAPGPSGS
jgi:Flp pilus assembly pilin Flp